MFLGNRFLLYLLPALGLLVLTAWPAGAATVTTEQELRDALEAADTTINIPNNTIIDISNQITINNGSAFSLTGSTDGSTPTAILDGQETSRILDMRGNIDRIEGIIVQNAYGAAANNHSNNESGGAFYVNGNILGGVHNSVFRNNVTEDVLPPTINKHAKASALYVTNLSGGINNSTFEGNTADYNGAVYVSGTFRGGIVNSHFLNNTTKYNGADGRGSAGITIETWGDGDISGSTFIGNTGVGNIGGAVAVHNGPLNGNIEGSTFTDNILSDSSSAGGAIGVSDYSTGLIQGRIYNSHFTGNKASLGGAINALGLTGGILDSTFSDNEAYTSGGGALTFLKIADGTGRLDGGIVNSHFSGNIAGGQGGAIRADGGIYGGIADSTFTNNQANSDGGAIVTTDMDGAISNSTFEGNESRTTSANYGGGAIIALGTVSGNIENSKFMNNKAAKSGGSIFVNRFQADIVDSTFEGNQAGEDGGAIYFFNPFTGNISGSTFKNNSASGLGGAIHTLQLNQVSNSLFEGNTVNGAADQALKGLGGAIYLRNDLILTGSRFINNSAVSANSADPSSGRGGAIFHDNRASTPSNPDDPDSARISTVSLNALDAANPVIFAGNTHQPGGEPVSDNSLYFGSTATDGGLQQTNLRINAQAGAEVLMYDGLAAQAYGLTDVGGNPYNRVLVNVEKTGPGVWTLAGTTRMQGGDWDIREGELHFIGDYAIDGLRSADPTSLDLGDNSTFRLRQGTTLTATVGALPHGIRASRIILEEGSSSTVTGPYARPFLAMRAAPSAAVPVLTLEHGDELLHEQALEQAAGTMEVGLANRDYRLYWGGENNNTLYLEFVEGAVPPIDPIPLPVPLTSPDSRGAVSAVTAPGAMAYYNAGSRQVKDRAAGLLTSGIELRNNLWITPHYGNVDQKSGGGRAGYDIDSYGLTIGYDRLLTEKVFLGAAVNLRRSDYDSRDADLKGKEVEGLIYGGGLLPGQLELTAYAGLGRTDYDQDRQVGEFTYDSDYDSWQGRIGAELGRRFPLSENVFLRPFVSYEYLKIEVDGYDEGEGVYAIKTDDFDQAISEFKVGANLGWQSEQAFVNGGLYYSHIPSGRRAKTSFVFYQNPEEEFETYGNKLSKDAWGLGLNGGLNLTENVSLNLGYELEKGDHTLSQQGTLSLMIAF